MSVGHGDARRVKGVTLVGLVKALKVYRRSRPLTGLSRETQTLLDDRILVSNWYPLRVNLEMLHFVYRELIGSDPKQAIAVGVAAGKDAWAGAHRAFVAERGAEAALRSMVPAWASYFDFASLHIEKLDANAVRFTIRDYPDVPIYQGLTIAGWHVAAAQIAGSATATVELVACPWDGAPEQVHIVRF